MSSSYPSGLFPLPEKGIDDGEFWEACNRGELVIQQCADCGELRHPPIAGCPDCHSFDVEWKEVPGTGEVFTYTVTHYAAGPGYEEHAPYNVTVVLLDGTEDVRMVTHMVDVDYDDIEIGMPVEVAWETVDEETTLPLFRPAR